MTWSFMVPRARDGLVAEVVVRGRDRYVRPVLVCVSPPQSARGRARSAGATASAP